MKLSIASILISAMLVLTCTAAYAGETIRMEDLSRTPSQVCKKPPKEPPYKLMHTIYHAYGTSFNYPFTDTVDINGDGWCDWVSTVAGAPHRGDIDEPEMKDFIFLGTRNGWRKFGDMEKFRSDRTGLTLSTGWLAPDAAAYAFINPVFIYSVKDPLPYVAIIELNEDILDPFLENVSVLRWNNTFDMLREVSKEEKIVVIAFLRKTLCESGKNRQGNIVQRAICGKQTID